MNLYLYGRASPVVMVDPNGMDSGAFQEINRELNTPEGFLPDIAGMVAQGVQAGVGILTSGASGVVAKTTEPGSMGFSTDVETQDELADAEAQRLFQERRGEASFLEAAGRVGWSASQIGALPEIDPGDLHKILAEEWAYPRFGDAAVGDQAAKAGDPRGNADLEFTFSILPTALTSGLRTGAALARLDAATDVSSAVDDAFKGLTEFELGEVPQLGTRSQSSYVALDANAVVAAVERGESAFLQGRGPIVSITAAKEFLAGPGSSAAGLRNFLSVNGGRIGVGGPEQLASGLQVRAAARGRVLDIGDARVAANAIVEDVPLVTFDKRFGNFLREFGWKVEP